MSADSNRVVWECAWKNGKSVELEFKWRERWLKENSGRKSESESEGRCPFINSQSKVLPQ